MTVPARRTQKQQVHAMQVRQIWAVLIVAILAMIVELYGGLEWFGGHGFIDTKSLLCGALLHFLAQYVFTFVAYRLTGARVRQQIMLNMYLGQMLKWLVVMLGFAFIFIYLKPILAMLVIAGYVIMQLVYTLSMWRLA
ncbi:hypothetical protein [Moraxella sp. ZY200743]|uniref:hypothetical protein n=1 Tax=Moraxella sp. ZY200743 TaxID=2911970 RepID=UPI003D7E7B28